MKPNKILLLTVICTVLLVSLVNSAVQCVPFGDVSFNIPLKEYGISKTVTFSPKINSQVGNKFGIPAYVKQIEVDPITNEETIIDQSDELNVGENNIVGPFTFTSLDHSGKMKFELVLKDPLVPTGKISFQSSILDVKKSLKLTISAQPEYSNVNEIKINVFVADADSPSIRLTGVTIVPEITINGELVSNPSISSTEIKFTTDKIGYGTAKVTASSVGFVLDSKTITFNIRAPSTVVKVKVDGKDYDTLDEGRIDTGKQKLEIITTLDGSRPLRIDKVDAEMARPDGGSDDVVFTATNTDKNIWTSYYTFLDKDRTYTLTATLKNFETGQDIPLDSIEFSTVGLVDPCDENPNLPECGPIGPTIPIWVWIVGGIVLLIIILGVLFAIIRRRVPVPAG